VVTTVDSPPTACLRSFDGSLHCEDARWVRAATTTDEHVLRRAEPPVLDIGCGPGRHVVALAASGIPVLGIDITPIALRAARSRGALVLERSVFERVPGAGRWASALLLDGNVGIGGDPAALLRRVLGLLCPGGLIVVELGAPSTSDAIRTVRLELAGRPGPWFRWADVPVDRLASLATRVGASVDECWCAADGRWFATLVQPA
jgi:SAM-dependent methyltransferase